MKCQAIEDAAQRGARTNSAMNASSAWGRVEWRGSRPGFHCRQAAYRPHAQPNAWGARSPAALALLARPLIVNARSRQSGRCAMVRYPFGRRSEAVLVWDF